MKRIRVLAAVVLIALGGDMLATATAQASSTSTASASVKTGNNGATPRKLAGGSGQCEVPRLKVTGNGSKKKPCKYMIPHGSDIDYRSTDLQNKCGRFYTSQRYSIFTCWRIGVSNKYYTGGFGAAGDTKNRFWTELTLARCLTPRGANIRCPYLHLKIRIIANGKSRTLDLRCGTGTGHACPKYGYSGKGVGSAFWAFGGSIARDSTGCQTHWGGIQFASAYLNRRWVKTTHVPSASRYTARWKACDRATVVW